MSGSAKHNLLLVALLMSMMLIGACENDLKNIKELSAKESEKPEQLTVGVDVIYSDSAKVKLRLQTPLLIEYTDTAKNAKEYRTTPDGVKIILYDTLRRVMATVVADSSIQFPRTKIIEFHRNVVATNASGETFKSEVLIWDQEKKIIYSNQPVQVTSKGSDIVHSGTSFTSDEKLVNPKFGPSTGIYDLSETP